MAALASAQGAVFEDDVTAFWSRDSSALVASDAMVLCGLARITNKAALVRHLPGSADPPIADMELVLALCCARGAAALEELEGQFSLVLWDRIERTLTVIRDRFGVLPSFWTADPVTAVSSDLRLLAHVTGRSLAPDLPAVADYLAGTENHETRTGFQALLRLPQAHKATWQPGQPFQHAAYWSLALPDLLPPRTSAAAVKGALKTAVAHTLDHEGETACMLSGGLDSSTLAMLAAEVEPDEALKTLSFVYRDTDSYNEKPFIDDVNAAITAEPIIIPIEGPPKVAALPALVEEQFDLCTAPGLMKSRQIYAAAREHGITAVLDGHGGDEVISHGYGRQAELASKAEYWRLWREMRGAARIYGSPFLENYLAFLFNFAPLAKRSLRRRMIGFVGRRIARAKQAEVPAVAFLDDAFRESQRVEEQTAKPHKDAAPEDRLPSERRDHLENITSPLMTRAFEVLRRSAQAHDVEPLYPFFDQALVETCLAVPSDQKLRGGWSRWILRQAMDGRLPKSIQWRPDKADFSAEVLHFVLDYLSDPQRKRTVLERLDGMVDLDRFEAAHQALMAKTDQTATGITLTMWRCLYLAEWLGQVQVWNAQQDEGTLWQTR
ncbi:MAG: asparagine synthase-related protein [Pseudomonadota bacterium]